MNPADQQWGAPSTPAPSIDASSSELVVATRNFIWQAILVAGALVALLGLPETSWIAHTVRFLKSAEGLPLIGLAASLGASGRLLWRAVKKHRSLQVTSFFLPQKVAKSPERPSAAVVAAVEAATVVVDRAGVAPPRAMGEQ